MKNFIIAILSVAVVGLLVLMITKQKTQAPTLNQDETNTLEDSQESDSENETTPESENNSASGSNSGFTSATIYLHVPQPEATSCLENIVTVYQRVSFPETQAILTASLEQLLLITEDSIDDQIQNWVSSERGFSLDSVSIDNGTARVQFGHNQDLPFSSDCQYFWFKEQVVRTANQYPTVSATEVFINDLKL